MGRRGELSLKIKEQIQVNDNNNLVELRCDVFKCVL